jgi:hypothetical protein
VFFHTVHIVKGLMEKTSTNTGLQVTVNILNQVYETGRPGTSAWDFTWVPTRGMTPDSRGRIMQRIREDETADASQWWCV